MNFIFLIWTYLNNGLQSYAKLSLRTETGWNLSSGMFFGKSF